MKKFVAIFSTLVVLAYALTACSNKAQTNTEKTSQSTKEGMTSYPATEEMTSFLWPTFAPTDIKLIPNEILLSDETWDCILKYRSVYYGIPGFVGDLARNSGMQGPDIDALHAGSNGTFIESDEMDIVVWVKHFGILKENFIVSMEKRKQWWQEESGLIDEITFDWEVWELPNADIIYTFDNEIINAYYRRENPVVPEPGTYRTYESYEEYLKATTP